MRLTTAKKAKTMMEGYQPILDVYSIGDMVPADTEFILVNNTNSHSYPLHTVLHTKVPFELTFKGNLSDIAREVRGNSLRMEDMWVMKASLENLTKKRERITKEYEQCVAKLDEEIALLTRFEKLQKSGKIALGRSLEAAMELAKAHGRSDDDKFIVETYKVLKSVEQKALGKDLANTSLPY